MRKKYYLRGLGIGILVTAAILSILSESRSTKMTDEEVIERAKELGMIENTTLVKPDNAFEDSKQNGSEDDKEADEEADGNEAGNAEDGNMDGTAGNNSGASDGAETVDPDNKDDANAGSAGQVDATDNKDNANTGGDDQTDVIDNKDNNGTGDDTDTVDKTENADEAEYVTITINKGDSSYKAALLLKEAGLIENARDFDAFLSKHGYDKRIRVGEHKVKKNATYEEMAEAIASKKK